MRPFAPNAAAYDAFVQQWFHQVVVPEYELSSARRVPLGSGSRVTVRIKNAGTGRMPVELSAEKGERFDEEDRPNRAFREARATLILGAGEAKTVTIDCPFTAERVIVDPDVRVLQLRRKSAVTKL
jgi:hypothetical protein